jgi:Ca2+:H+ antiporter
MTGQNILRLLLVFVPVSIYLGMTHASPTWVFVAACLAILPLAGLMGEATEHLTHHTGPGVGGLLNASFGNAAELIIAFMALRAGEIEIVKASLTGSIIGNMLMVLGLAMLLGGWKRKELLFNRLGAESSSSMMVLAVVALVIPTVYALVTHHKNPGHIESISLDISIILILTYAAGLVFSLKTHQRLFEPLVATHEPEPSGEKPWSVKKSVGVLLGAATFVGLVSEFLVHAVDAAGTSLGLGKVFMGVVVVAVVGNAAEHSTAIVVALKNKMDLSLGIAMGSSMQIALFVAPVLVIAGHVMGKPLGLEFTILEVVAVMLSTGAVALLIHDGKTKPIARTSLVELPPARQQNPIHPEPMAEVDRERRYSCRPTSGRTRSIFQLLQ